MSGIVEKIKSKLPGHHNTAATGTTGATGTSGLTTAGNTGTGLGNTGTGYGNTAGGVGQNTTGMTGAKTGTGMTGTGAGTGMTGSGAGYGANTTGKEPIGERIKDAVTGGHKTGSYENTAAATGTSTAYGTGHSTGYGTGAGTGYGQTGTGYNNTVGDKEPMGERIKDAVGMGHHGHTHTHGTTGATGVLGQQTYSTVEEAATIKEHVQVVREHHPVQHNYVVETKEVGVRELPAQVESLGVTERVLEETPVRGHAHHAPLSAAGLASPTTTTQQGGMGVNAGMTGQRDNTTRHDTRTTHELK